MCLHRVGGALAGRSPFPPVGGVPCCWLVLEGGAGVGGCLESWWGVGYAFPPAPLWWEDWEVGGVGASE